jgi:hypothetical protein
MQRISLSLACYLLLFVAAGYSQEAMDSVTGRWGREGRTYLELKLEGKSRISGTAIWRMDEYEHRAPIKTGVFEPKTGAFKLEGDAKTPEGSLVPYVIEGKVEKDTVSGNFRFGERSGQFSFTRM